ncbi:MAG: PilZ protein [Alphaproteobacteria bacterium]|nr:PilZ protein [Alphaproteobacteria bacterium]
MTIETAHQLGVDRYNVRKPDRVRLLLSTQLRVSGQPDIAVDVRNISARGFMADAEHGMAIGSDVMLYLPGIGWSLASIRWSVGGRFGGRFSDSIDLRTFWRANPPKQLAPIGEERRAG